MENIYDKTYNNHRISCVFHEGGERKLVIFCHGFSGTNVGGGRRFVLAARQLAARRISSLRFDQYGSGNSGGDFSQSGFYDWVKTISAIVQAYRAEGYAVALLGESAGGAAALAAAAQEPSVCAVAAWAPDPKPEDFSAPPESPIEVNGQMAQANFWQEVYMARIADKFAALKMPVYLVQCTADEHVDRRGREMLSKKAQPHHTVENFEGYRHSDWSYAEGQAVIGKSVDFLARHFPQQQPAVKQERVSAPPVMDKAAAQRKIRQILEDEKLNQKQKKSKKPKFNYKDHLQWTILSGGLWLPVWIAMSLLHDYRWKQAQRKPNSEE